MTARFQSDPIERRFGQYRQMSGGRFLISAKDIAISEKILKVETLVKEGLQLDTGILLAEDDPVDVAKLMDEVELLIGQSEKLTLSKESIQVSDTVAGYIAHKAGHLFDGYYQSQLTDDKPNTEYIGIPSREGLKNPSLPMSNAVSQAFPILDATSETIRNSHVPARKAGMRILQHYLNCSFIVCSKHTEAISSSMQLFLNNQRKQSNELIVKQNVAEFKRPKRQKT